MAMSAKVLQLANCGFFGLAQSVTTLDRAVAHLGMNTIANLALASETFQAFKPDPRIPETFRESMQRRALDTAKVAGSLPIDRNIREHTLIAALLCDIGTLILASRMPDEFCRVLSVMRERGCEQFEAEEEVLGITHAEIGAYLLGLWGIANPAVEAIAHHHRPTRIAHEGLDCSAAVYLAELLVREIEAHPDDPLGEELSDPERAQMSALGLLDKFPEYKAAAIDGLWQGR
jgi:HD-like signal output (HDOD) protein